MGAYQPVKLDDLSYGVAKAHHYRYYCARGFIEPGDTVIDVACGMGYGSALMARVAKKVIGIDRDKEAIAYAMNTYKKDNCYFVLGNLDQLEKLPECDVAVSVESIEHLRFPESFASKLKLTTKRKIFLTTPWVPTIHEDPTHLHDFNEEMIINMFVDDNWECIDSSKEGPYLLIAFYRK
jgi:2-polyprenyl-3-methyl-5-hydroxy-6-metoxy-1,4-benzoquinol methylase